MSSHQPNGTSTQQQQQSVPPITIAVMGATGSGMTSFVNTSSGSNLLIGMNLESSTANVQLADEFTLDGQRVLLVDTPGFDNTHKSDTDILKLIATFLASTYRNGLKLAGIIYLHRITSQNLTGITRRNFGMFRKLCGDSTLKNVILVTNMWGDVSPSVGEARERELVQEFFKPVLDKGAQLARHHNTTKSAHDIIRCIMKNQPIALQIQRELVDEGKGFADTAAGRVVNDDVNGQVRRHQAEIKAVQEEILRARKENDEDKRRELEEERRKIQEKINQMRAESEGMADGFNEEKRRMEETMRRIQEQARKEREQAEAGRSTDSGIPDKHHHLHSGVFLQSSMFNKISTPQQPQLIPPITIAVMGARGSGKTSFINMGSGSNLRTGSSLLSLTAEVQVASEFTLDGQRVLLVDIPGFDDTDESYTNILKLIAASLATTYQNGSKLTGIVYLHRISDQRITRTAGRNFRMLREICGDPTLKNIIIVTNMWGVVSSDVGETREQELVRPFFKPALDQGAQLARHYNTTKSAHDIVRCVMKNQPIALQIQRELVDEGKGLADTAAGRVVNEELDEMIRCHQAELKLIREEMLRALKENDEATRRELQEEMRKIYEDVNKMRMDSEGMAADYDEEKWRMEEAVRRMQEETRQERDRAEAECRKRIDDLNQRLQHGTSLAALLSRQHHRSNAQRTSGTA